MAWTQQQCEEVFDDYWWSGCSSCPVDQAVFSFTLTEFIDGNYLLSGFCPRCSLGIKMGREHDPRQEAFRHWTDEERAGLIDAHFQQQLASCPVCSSTVQGQATPYIGGNFVSMRCIRCGNGHRQDFPRAQM